jgi:hypothetical protein
MPVRTFSQVSYDDIHTPRILFTSHPPLSYTDGGSAITWRRANFMFLSCALLLGYCHYMYYNVYTERERERERERPHCLSLPPTGSCLSGDTQILNITIVYLQGTTITIFSWVGSCPFYYIGVWVSIPFDMRWYILCVGFPTNRMLFCVGSKRVCGGRWGGVVACRAGGGLLINGLIVPVVICSSHPCASAWHFVQLTEGVGRSSNSSLSYVKAVHCTPRHIPIKDL